MSIDVLVPLKAGAAALTAATAPTAGQVTRYDATGGALAPPLPALSGLTVGATFGLQKDEADSSANVITITCAGSDTLVSGSTTTTLKLKGSWKILQVVLVSAAKKWQIIEAHDPLTQLDARYAGIPAVASAAYAATVTPAVGTAGTPIVLNIGALTGNITLANPTGTPVDAQTIKLRMAQDATGSRTVSFGTAYAFGTDVTTSLIPSAASSKWEMLFEWNAADSKWRALAVVRGF